MLDMLQFGKFVCQVDHTYSQVCALRGIKLLILFLFCILISSSGRRIFVQIQKLGYQPTDLISKVYSKLRVGSLLSLINGQEFQDALERTMETSVGSIGMYK